MGERNWRELMEQQRKKLRTQGFGMRSPWAVVGRRDWHQECVSFKSGVWIFFPIL